MAGSGQLGAQVGTSAMGSGAVPTGQQFSQPSQMSGGLGNQYQLTPPQNGSFQMPSSVQRMPGGFGLSPQMLTMIAALQQRQPKFTPGQVPNQFGVVPGFKPAQNPYQQVSPGGGFDPFGQGRFGR